MFLDWLLRRPRVQTPLQARRVLRNRAQCTSCGDVVESTSEEHAPKCCCGHLVVSGGLVQPQRHMGPVAPIVLGQGLQLGHASGFTDLSEYAN
jgi:hypothetical protein